MSEKQAKIFELLDRLNKEQGADGIFTIFTRDGYGYGYSFTVWVTPNGGEPTKVADYGTKLTTEKLDAAIEKLEGMLNE